MSFGLPVNYRERTENGSWELGGTVSWSYAKNKSQRRYPLVGLFNQGMTAEERCRLEPGSSSTGVGYTLRALLERRLSSHLSTTRHDLPALLRCGLARRSG